MSVSVRTLTAAPALLAFWAILASCGDAEESPAPTLAPTATPSADTPTPSADGGAGGPLGSPTVISPPATPSADAIVPADWLTYRDPEGRFTVRYPPLWFAERGGFSTFKLGSVGPRFPEEAIKIDVGYTPESQLGGCTKDPQATQVQIAGETAWLVVKNYQDPVVTRSYQAWVPYHGYCYAMLALFSQRQPDDELFMKFVNSFRFGK